MHKQQDALVKALERARRHGLAVMGQGTWTSCGARFFVVSSASTPGAYHIVTVYPGRLSCDCTAGQHGRLCQHRALAHEALERERAEAEGARQFQIVSERLESMRRDLVGKLDDLATRRETAPLARPAFSIFAAN